MVNGNNIDIYNPLKGSDNSADTIYFSEILQCVIGISRKYMQYDRGLILLADNNREMLFPAASFGFPYDFSRVFERHCFYFNNPSHDVILADAFTNRKSYIVNDINNPEFPLSVATIKYAKQLGATSFICCPIISASKTLGVICVNNYKTKRPLVPDDLNILKSLAFIIGMAISNKGLANSECCHLHDIVTALAENIDIRDPLNACHSQNVTEYALGICRELGVSKGYSDIVQLAATLHDYGKKNVPEHILKKHDPLTDHEYELLKTHAEKTRKGLEKIHFPGKFKIVPKIAGSHHEKFDGSGYPQGLKGKRIPLGSRIIAVADYFDAITSNRHYRTPMPVSKAFNILHDVSKSHLDLNIVEAFIRYYTKLYPENDTTEMVNNSVECCYT